MMALVDGRVVEFVRSGFRRLPTEYWLEQWQLIAQGLLQAQPQVATQV